jgi:hypothetical protein
MLAKDKTAEEIMHYTETSAEPSSSSSKIRNTREVSVQRKEGNPANNNVKDSQEISSKVKE